MTDIVSGGALNSTHSLTLQMTSWSCDKLTITIHFVVLWSIYKISIYEIEVV